MKGKFLFTILPILSISLTSCGQVNKYIDHLDDYVYTMKYRNDFTILQLTDIHWNYATSTETNKRYLDKVINETYSHTNNHIDLIEITGDLFMVANSYHVDEFIKYFEQKSEDLGFKYAVIWGNHDHHGLYNPNSLSKKFAKAKNCFHIDPEDDLYGRSNFVINLTLDGTTNTETKWQIANLDSGASFSETTISPFKQYDYIHDDQTDWWFKEHHKVGDNVPGIAYYHIPQDENRHAWENRSQFKNKFFRLEHFFDNKDEKYASDFLDIASQYNLKAAFMGHAHKVDWTVDYKFTNDKIVTIGLGVKTGKELYFGHITTNRDDPLMIEGLSSVGINENFDLIGASLVTIKDEVGAFDLEHLYLNERVNGDFIKWVQY